MPDNSGVLASYYAALLNAIGETGGEVPDEVLEACHDELLDSEWTLEWSQGAWRAVPGE